jgi:twinkle protein
VSESSFTGKEPCPKCGSADNLARYSDGHAHCFTPGCDHWEPATDGEEVPRREPKKQTAADLIQGEVQALPKRGIHEQTCDKFGYRVGKDKHGKTCQVAPYFDGNELVAQKLRYADKSFKFIGEAKRAALFGQQLWRDGGKMIVITEGEIDCLTVAQLQGLKWPVVSIQNGAQSAKKALSQQLDWLEKFEIVVLMFDMDDAGQKAVAECAPIFSPGKCKVARLPLKDANDMLLAGRGGEVIEAIWGAKIYRPDGLVSFSEIKDRIKKAPVEGHAWWSPTLTTATFGRRYGELYAFGAGTGVGKTDFLTQQIAYDIGTLGLKVGLLFLETPIEDLGKRVAGKMAGKLFHIPGESWTQEELDAEVDRLDEAGTLYDSFGQTDWDVVKGHIRFMAVSQGIRIFYLDHLTALADTQDEKGSLEQIMKEMAGLANELDVLIHFVSHLSTPEGKPHEEGGRVMIRHFKGSRAIGFWAHFMFGLERDQQSEDESIRQTTTFRILKDRYTGRGTGQVIYLSYDRESGKLQEASNPFNDETTEDSPFSTEKRDF